MIGLGVLTVELEEEWQEWQAFQKKSLALNVQKKRVLRPFLQALLSTRWHLRLLSSLVALKRYILYSGSGTLLMIIYFTRRYRNLGHPTMVLRHKSQSPLVKRSWFLPGLSQASTVLGVQDFSVPMVNDLGSKAATSIQLLHQPFAILHRHRHLPPCL